MSESLAKQRPMIDFDEFERRLQRPAAPERGDEDPLAELARLVGGGADPYRGMFDLPAGAAREAPAVPQAWDGQSSYTPPKSHPLAGDFAAIEAGLLRGALPEAHDQGQSPAYDPAGYYPGEEPAFDAAGWPQAAADKPRSRRPLMVTAAVIALGLAGIGASFALKGRVGGSREVATIAAVPGPTKVQPTTQDGVDVPSQDATILEKTPRPNAVALSNNREQPVDLSRLPERTPKVLSVGNAPLTGAALSDQQAASADVPPTAAQPTSIASLIEPRKVKTVSVRPDGTVVPNETTSPASAPAGASRPAPPTPAAVAKPSTPKSTARVTTTPKPSATPSGEGTAPMQLAGAKPKPASPPARLAAAQPADDGDDEAAPAAAGGGGGFAVQLAAPGSAGDARDAISKFSSKYASELGGRRPSVVKASVGSRDVYRVRIVNLSREDATALCEKLKAGGGACFVAKN